MWEWKQNMKTTFWNYYFYQNEFNGFFVKKKLKIMRKDCEHISWKKYVMFGNSFYFLFSKTCFGEYKEKTIFLYFLNRKNVWLVEIKKKN